MSLRKIFSAAGALGLACFVILLLSLPVLAAPTLMIQDFSSNNADLTFAKVNDTVTLTFLASEPLLTTSVIVTIAGRPATVFQAGNASSWIATQQMLATDPEGNIAFSVSYADLLGNAGPIVTDADYGNTVVFDKTPPVAPVFNPANNTTINYTNVTLAATYAESVVVTASTLTGLSGTTNISLTTSDTFLYTYSTPNLAAGGYVLSITAEDWAGNSTLSLVNFTAGPNLVVTTASLPSGTVGTLYSQNLVATGGSGGNTWAFTAGKPAWLSIDALTGIISGTPNTAGLYNFTVRVTDSSTATAIRDLSITVNTAPVSLTVTTLSLPDSIVGASYNQTVMATGGSGIYTWARTAGALPAGLALNPSGVISGTLATAGTYNFTLQVTDDLMATAIRAFSIVITDVSLPTLTIQDFSSNNADLTLAKVNDTVTLTFTASEDLQTPTVSIAGRAATVFSAGNLMSWFATQEMAATDTEGNIAFSVTYLNLVGNAGTNVTNANYANNVVFDKTPPVAPLFNPLNNATIYNTNVTLTATYSESVTVTNNTLTDLAGTTNIVMTTADTLLYTYSTANLPAGDYVLLITAEDRAGNSTQALVNFTAGPNLLVTTASLPAGTVAATYNQTLVATGGSGVYTWARTVGALPAGLSLDPTGVISGIPTTPGTYIFTVEVTDSLTLTASQNLAITINPVLLLTTLSLPTGTFGVAYNQTLVSTGGSGGNNWALTAGVLPAGLNINATNGNISGIPTAAGTFNFTVGVTDNLGSTAPPRALSITINPVLQVTTASLPWGNVVNAYSQTLVATGGSGGNIWAVTAGLFPPGLNLNTSTGLISGTPTTGGVYNFTVRVTESLGSTDSQALSITIYDVLQLTTTSLPVSTVGTAYNQTLVAAGGSGGYTWAVTSGALPAGVTLNTSTGLISGTPTTIGTYNFTVRVTDSLAATSTRALSITLNEIQGGMGGGGSSGGGTSTPTPTPTPVATPINATRGTLSWVPNASGLTPSNMTLTSADGKTLVSIPQSTLAEDQQGQPLSGITCVPLSSSIPAPPSKMIIASYEMGPSGATFNPAIRITMSYDPALIPAGASAEDLVLAFYDVSTSTWITLNNIVVDTQNQTVSGTTTHFTQFSLILPRVVVPVTTPVSTTQPAPTTTTAQPSPIITPAKTTTPAVSSPAITPTPTQPSANGKTGIIIPIIGLILVVAVVLGAVIIWRRRRNISD